MLYISQYPVDTAKTGVAPEVVTPYVRAGVTVAQALDVPVLDLHPLIDDDRFARFIFEDGMHFNGDGHAFIAERILARLTELGWVA